MYFLSTFKNSNSYHSKQLQPITGGSNEPFQNKICVFLPYALGAYHSVWHIREAQRFSDGTEPMYPSTWEQRQKYAPFLLLHFQCKWQIQYLVTHCLVPHDNSFIHSLLLPHFPSHCQMKRRITNPFKSHGALYL